MSIYHNHHVIPRHMKSPCPIANITIQLTVEEHANMHHQLHESYGKIEDLWAYQLLSNQITFEQGFSKVLSKNAKDTHQKCKKNNTGFYNSKQQSENGKKGAKASGLGKKNSANNIRICCLGCGKDTTLPTFKGYHIKRCFD